MPRDLLTDAPYPELTVPQPQDDDIEAMLTNHHCTATDGCDDVDPDGICRHGHPS